MSKQQYYLAYGSNLHPLRLLARTPDSRLRAIIRLDGCELRFHKRGADGSGKCDLLAAGSEQVSYGALYQMTRTDGERLDEWEGGYQRISLALQLKDRRLQAFSYQASSDRIDPGLKPYDWYHGLVEAGAQYLGFPGHSLRSMQAIAVAADGDSQRHLQHQQLLQQLREFNRRQSTPTLPQGHLLDWL